MISGPVREHEHEPVVGLPEKLPGGEFILWQGRPDGRSIAKRVMKTNWLAFYFAILAAWAFITGIYDGRGIGSSTFSAASLMVLGAVAIGLVEAYAWGVQKTTLYTITNRRIVMRIGVALPFTMNLPFAKITSASVRHHKRGRGDIALEIARSERLSWVMMWPHVRAMRFIRPEPAFRCIPKVDEVAGTLAEALKAYGAVDGAEDAPRVAAKAAEAPREPEARHRDTITAAG